MFKIFQSLFLNYGLSIILSSLLSDLRVEAGEIDNVKPESEGQAQVEVRAVMINCRLNDGEVSPDTEAARFQREELFKHNALKDCSTKLALVLKLASFPERNSDEYIPIDHVIEGPSKRRVRLLNPYVLRLRWETPLQVYKLQNMDTVTGVIAENNKQYNMGRINTKFKKDRVRRSTRQSVKDMPDSLGFTAIYDVNEWKKLATPFTFESESKVGLEESTDYGNYSNTPLLRKRRQQYNIMVEPQITDVASWMSNFDRTDGSVGTAAVEQASEPNRYEHQDVTEQNRFWKKRINHFDKYLPREEKSSYNRHSHPKNVLAGNSDDIFLDSEYFKENSNMASNRENFRNGPTSSERSKYVLNDINSSEKMFSIYDIGSPDIWCLVHLQLFEKLSTLEGKTVWNDITKGEIASVSSIAQEWRDQDLHVRYRSAEWMSQDHFSLPVTSNLCLLVPHSGDQSEYLIIPTEDVILINDEVSLKKRNENSSKDATTEASMDKHPRKVMVRVTRNLRSNIADVNIVKHGSEQYLTLPHRRPHHIQIDLETRADDNQLIRVGAYGRLTTVVSDNSRRTRTVFTVQATNTGLAAAKFKLKTRDCGPELSSLIQDKSETGTETDFVLIPPHHTKKISLDLPFELPGDTAHCSVTLINQDDTSVAIRDVAIKRGDRCFCVWHCDCVCLSEDPRLLCREMSESRQAAAGLTRDRARRTRAVCYPDDPYINITSALIGVPIILLFLGLLKACFGLVFRPIGTWHLDKIVEMPRKLEFYHESNLANKRVVYDDAGWPVHPKTKERTVRVISSGMEFVLNLIFFIAMPCLICWKGMKQVYARSDSGERRCAFKDNKSRFNSVDFQEQSPRLRLRRARLRGWMTPEAEHLSAKVWRDGLLPQRSFNCNFMQPLLHEDDSRADGTHSSSMDSEQDDTEYVLTQMQKSRESLARTQMMNNNNSQSTK